MGHQESRDEMIKSNESIEIDSVHHCRYPLHSNWDHTNINSKMELLKALHFPHFASSSQRVMDLIKESFKLKQVGIHGQTHRLQLKST